MNEAAGAQAADHRLLDQLLVATAGWLAVLAAASWPAMTVERAAWAGAGGTGMLVVGVAALLRWFNKVRAAEIVYLSCLGAGAVLCAALSGGVQSPYLGLLGGLAVAAAALMGMRGALTVAGGGAVAVALLAVAGQAGWFSGGTLAVSTWTAAAVHGQVVTMVVLSLLAFQREAAREAGRYQKSRARGEAAASRSMFLWDCQTDRREYGEDLQVLAWRDVAAGGTALAMREFDAAVKNGLRELVEMGAPGFEHEFPVRIGGGDEIWLRARASVTSRDPSGNPLHVSGSLTEVTEFRQARAELVKARDRAQEAARAKAAFLANMSHEIRTPLSAIVGLADILLLEELAPRPAELVRLMQSSGRMLLSVINDILDLSRIEAGQLTLRREALDPEACAEEVISLLRHAAERKRLRLSYRPPGRRPERVMADAARVRQILVNLVDNAIKFTESGSVEVGLEWTPGVDGDGTVRYRVTDAGIGIPLESQERVFQRFSQVDDSLRRPYGGTGLGLSICRHLAELMGGTMGFVSAPGAGSTFWIELPVRVAGGREEGRTSGVARLPQYPQLRVLVVEDNATNRLVVERLLAKFGIQAGLACDGEQAVASATANPFDLILMDVQMPGMDGLQASRAIRLCGRGSPRIVALTAHVLPEDRVACLEAGMHEFLSKPVDRAALGDLLERCSGALAADGAGRGPAG